MLLVVFVILWNIMLKRRASKRFVLDQTCDQQPDGGNAGTNASAASSTATSNGTALPDVNISMADNCQTEQEQQQQQPTSPPAPTENVDQNSNKTYLTPNTGTTPTLK